MPRSSADGSLLALGEELARTGSWTLDLGSLEVRWSAGMFRTHGVDSAEHEPSLALMLERTHPEDRGRLESLLTRIREHPESIPADGLSAEYRVVDLDGGVRRLRSRGRLAPGGWVSAAQDITVEGHVPGGRAHPALSDRELDVLRLAAEGNTGPLIAERLFVGPATVKTHFEHIFEKLGVGDRAAAVAEAIRSGLIR